MTSVLSTRGQSKLNSFWVSVSTLSYDARGRNRNVNDGGSQPVRHTDITDTEETGRQTDRVSGNNWPLIFTFDTRVTFPSELEAWQTYCPADCMLTARRDKTPSWQIWCDRQTERSMDANSALDTCHRRDKIHASAYNRERQDNWQLNEMLLYTKLL